MRDDQEAASPDISLVNAHSKTDGSYNDWNPAFHPICLSVRSDGVAEASMVGLGRDSFARQPAGNLTTALSCATVDDPASFLILEFESAILNDKTGTPNKYTQSSSWMQFLDV